MPSQPEWVLAAMRHFMDAAASAIRARGAVHVALPGGSTPRAVLEAMASWYSKRAGRSGDDIGPADPRDAQRDVFMPDMTEMILPIVDWSRVHVYFGDERAVAPDDESSNYRMVRESLLDHVPILPEHVHRILGERPANEAADLYDMELDELFGGGHDGSFDLVALGLGEDGHTASLVPGAEFEYQAGRWAAVARAPLSPAQVLRVTCTVEALRRTRETVWWVRGREKAAVLRAALTGSGIPTMAPEIVPDGGRVTWVVDDGAGASLDT